MTNAINSILDDVYDVIVDQERYFGVQTRSDVDWATEFYLTFRSLDDATSRADVVTRLLSACATCVQWIDNIEREMLLTDEESIIAIDIESAISPTSLSYSEVKEQIE